MFPNPASQYPFPQHVTYAAGTIRISLSQDTQDDHVRAYYQHWKSDYLTEIAPTGNVRRFRIKCGTERQCIPEDPDMSEKTVSEGQGYAMMIIALMSGYEPEAQIIFDGLLKFAEAHPSEKDARLADWCVPWSEAKNVGYDNSAFDGDCDIAYALLLADKQWGGAGTINYRLNAERILAGLMESAVGPASRLPMLGDWVDPEGETYNQWTVRTSDFMPGHFRAFTKATHHNAWLEVLHRCQELITIIQTNLSPNTGLVPDFVIRDPFSHQWEPAPGDFLEPPHAGQYYFNAARVPWRLSTDALLSGDQTSLNQVRKISVWAKQTFGGNPLSISEGYKLDGSALNPGWDFSSAFAAPLGVAAMTELSHLTWLEDIYDTVRSGRSKYYEDTLSLLCLLVMTGNFWDPTLV